MVALVAAYREGVEEEDQPRDEDTCKTPWWNMMQADVQEVAQTASAGENKSEILDVDEDRGADEQEDKDGDVTRTDA